MKGWEPSPDDCQSLLLALLLAGCSPQRNFYAHSSKPPQMAHTNFGTGECNADKPLHRRMQRRRTSATEVG